MIAVCVPSPACIAVSMLILIAGYFGVRYIIDYVNKYNDKVNRVIEEAESNASQEADNEIMAIASAICSISSSFMPRLVTAGVPSRIPLVTNGDFG